MILEPPKLNTFTEPKQDLKWALGSITTNKTSGGDGIPAELFQSLKDDAVKVLHSICQQIWKTKIMASGPITSWEIDGEPVETVSDFIFLGCKITADGDCSHEIKGCLLLGRKVMTNLDSILKSRDITLPTKVHLVKAMVFPVVMDE